MKLLALLLLMSTAAFADDLAQQFQSPPASAKPQTFWMWMNGNITKEGITADLEALKRVGIGGAHIFNISEGIPHGNVQFNSPEWRELVKHAATEADRLGLELGMHNAAGWSSSGGPWNTPEHSMQIAVTSEKQVRGPARIEELLPQPKANLGFYRDAAVLAFRTPKAELERLPAPLKITTSDATVDATGWAQGAQAKPLVLPLPAPSQPQFIQWEFEQPQTARTLWVTPGRGVIRCQGQIESSDDGKTFRKIAACTLLRADEQQVLTFPPTKARFFRLLFTGADPRATKIALAQAEFSRRIAVESVSKKSLQAWEGPGPFGEAVGDATPEEVVSSRDVLDLTRQMAADGKLTWDVPAGDWTILRVGHTSTGRKNHPAPPEATGLECDKLSREAVQAHWDSLMGLLTKEVGPLAGKSFANVHVDSWEVATQNWTPKLPGEFARRRGYDLLRFLPVLTGRVVDSPQITDRFLWDFRRTIADLFAENYSGKFAEMAHKSGMTYSVEPYGSFPGMDLEYGRYADIPMTEFWTDSCTIPPKLAASVAHTNGRKLVGAESFTGRTPCSRWVNDPFSIKAQGDAAWCGGVNRFIFHRYAHQPWVNPTRFPGMTMGQWGMHFERTTTWWEQSTAWLTYIARAQTLLQSGRFVADLLLYCGEEIPGGMRYMPTNNIPKGYDYDGCDADTLLHRVSVQEGRLVLPSGMSYRVLVLPEGKTMQPQIARKIKELAAAGATIIGPKPTRAPGLGDYPRCDDAVRQIADEWGVLSDKSVGSVLASLGVKPDFECIGHHDATLHCIHRNVEGAEVYFVASPSMQAEDFTATFRVSGKQPEFWHPDSGRMEPCAVWREADGRTEVPLHFDPAGSVFVVFRTPAKSDRGDHLVAVERTGAPGAGPQLPFEVGVKELLTRAPGQFAFTYASGRTATLAVGNAPEPVELSGPWQLSFPPNWGAPSRTTLDKLISWTEHADAGVKYFSGTATYRKQFQFKNESAVRIELELGAVKNLAEVRLNGKDLGVLWKPPFCIEVTDAIRPGANDLEVRVTNLWVNRLIGDEQLPEDCQWNATSLKAWPQWLLDGKSSPTGRVTFTTWRHWKKSDQPLESGLLGPVTLRSVLKTPIP